MKNTRNKILSEATVITTFLIRYQAILLPATCWATNNHCVDSVVALSLHRFAYKQIVYHR